MHTKKTMETGPKDIPFSSCVPKIYWIVDIIVDVVNNLPCDLFDEIRPWESIITQYPLIHKFTVQTAVEAIYDVSKKRTVYKESLFPIDDRCSYGSLQQYLHRRPLRIMIIADNVDSTFNEFYLLVAKHFKSFIVSPEELVRQEIKNQTKVGKWLEKTLKIRKAVPICNVMKLLEQELEKEKYIANGFILTGFPIFPSRKRVYMENFVYDTDLNSDFMFSNEVENESFKKCVQRQLDFIYNLGGRPDYIIFINSNCYSEQFTEAIDLFQRLMILYFRENLCRLDCRIGIPALLSGVINRFQYSNYKINYECYVVNNNQNDAMSLEELCNTEKLLPNYKWWASKLGQICPVNLHHGRLRFCDSKFPVRYLKYIFLCFSKETQMQFMQNPSKYIKLEPKCRIAVIGPHKSGKTILSQYLAKFLKAEIYRNHTQKSKEITELLDFTSEKNDLAQKMDKENKKNREIKISEWTLCVLDLLNDIVSETLKETEKGKNSTLFTSKNAHQYSQDLEKFTAPHEWIKHFLLEYKIFETSLQNLKSDEFLSWLALKSEPDPLYKQYVIDGASLDINFWKNLLIQDELPDCVFFLKLSSLDKMFDIYSSKHNALCVNEKLINDTLYTKFADIKIAKQNYDHPSHSKYDFKKLIDETGFLIKNRYRITMDFQKGYQKVKAFLESHNVKCIDVDISKQTWTQSVLYAFSEYLSIYQPKAVPIYDFSDEESRKSNFTISSDLSIEFRAESESSAASNYINYGSALDWCPVSLKNENILKKGYSSYAAEHENKIYNMNSRENLNKFILNPMLYSKTKWAVPPPRIFILGLNHKNKSNFAENLSSSLNVENISYKQNLTSAFLKSTVEEFSIEMLSESYNKSKFLKDLKIDYTKGIVFHGYPFLFEQFNDLIEENMYPECVLIFSDREEIHQLIYRCVGRLHMMMSYGDNYKQPRRTLRLTSISAYVDALPDNEKEIVEQKCVFIMKCLEREIRYIEEACFKFGIPVLKIPRKYRLEREVQSAVNYINHGRHRGALFEMVKEITFDESTILLNSGYYRFSRFKYSCPVDVRRLMTYNHFEGLRMQGQVYPCIYLDFIYFICGKKNLKRFKRNPLEFITTCNPPQLCDALKIAVFGTSKSFVSSICQTIATEFGLSVLSLEDLNQKIDANVDENMLIEILRMEKNSTPNGFILDNIPLTPDFLINAALNTVDISLVIIIESSFEKVLENLSNENQNLENSSSLSIDDVKKEFSNTINAINDLKNSIRVSLFNIRYINGDENSWTTWDRVKSEIVKTTRCITSYKLKLIKNRCANLNYLNMFHDKAIFHRNINYFYCQVCLSLGKLKAFKYAYVNVGPEFYSDQCQNLLNKPYGYTNREIYHQFKFSNPFESYGFVAPIITQSKTQSIMCLFQYKDIFCWSCDDHTINFMLNTQNYCANVEKLKPLYVPFLVIGYTQKFVAFHGFCPVEYKNGQLEKGAMNLSVYYRRKVYLMANEKNTIEFLTYPEKYRNINFNICAQSKKTIIFKGIKEELISNILNEVVRLRPRHFALDARLSALTFIALKLKCQGTNVKYESYWNSIFRQFTKDCKKLTQEINKYSQAQKN